MSITLADRERHREQIARDIYQQFWERARSIQRSSQDTEPPPIIPFDDTADAIQLIWYNIAEDAIRALENYVVDEFKRKNGL